MAQRLTLQQIRDQIGFACDVTLGDTRYPYAMVDLWINQEIQDVQKRRADIGTGDYAKTTVAITATDATQPGGFLAREVATLPTDFLALRSVYVLNSSSDRWELEPMVQSDKEAYQDNQRPLFYTLLDATQTAEMRMRLWPPADQAYNLEVEYYTEHPTLVNVGDLWHYPAGCQDLVICGVALKQVLVRDGSQEPTQVQGVQMRYQAALDILSNDSRRDGGVLTMRNDRSRSDWKRRMWR